MTRKVCCLSATRCQFFLILFLLCLRRGKGEKGGLVVQVHQCHVLGVLFFPKDLNLKMVKQMVLIKR